MCSKDEKKPCCDAPEEKADKAEESKDCGEKDKKSCCCCE